MVCLFVGLLYASYPQWKIARTFTLNSLRGDGMGRAVLEPQILEEIRTYIETFIVTNSNMPIDMTSTLPLATSNIVSQLIFGCRFEYNDAMAMKVVDAVNNFTKQATQIVILENIPFAKYLFKQRLNQYQQMHTDAEEVIRHLVEERKQTIDARDPQGLLDRYLLQAQAFKGQSDSCFEGMI